MIEDNHLDEMVSPYNSQNFDLMYSPIKVDWTNLSLAKYAQDFHSSHLDELAALTEFLHSPSRPRLEKLLETYGELPEYRKSAFIRLIRYCNWLLQEIADQLANPEGIDALLACYDNTYIEKCLKRDEEIVRLAEVEDFVSITMHAALCGCILCILSSHVSNELKETIWNELLMLHQNELFAFLCYASPEFVQDGMKNVDL